MKLQVYFVFFLKIYIHTFDFEMSIVNKASSPSA